MAGRLLDRPVRRVLPRSLLGRSLLIILIPLVLVQLVALQIFYGSHLDLVSRRLSAGVAGEIAETIGLLRRFPKPSDRAWILDEASRRYELQVSFEVGAHLVHKHEPNLIGPMDDDFTAALEQSLAEPFTTDWYAVPHEVRVRVAFAGGVLAIDAPRKRLDTGTLYLFVAWVFGTSVLVFVIAALFMRNQVRAIRRLASAATAFGMGRDNGPIKAEGAVEVRRAAAAFNRMQERIRRFVAQRTEMLAGVSHDLRTPLTRLRLALAMLPHAGPEPAALAREAAEMTADVEEMERMIGGYIAFARGEGAEQAQPTDLPLLLEEVAASARRAGAAVEVRVPTSLTVVLRPAAIRRAVTNLVDNARRHGAHVALAAAPLGREIEIVVDDDGPGIPAPRRESVFRPFESGAAGGTGLGLTIARDIAHAHGGEITLEQSPLGGLRARLCLPL